MQKNRATNLNLDKTLFGSLVIALRIVTRSLVVRQRHSLPAFGLGIRWSKVGPGDFDRRFWLVFWDIISPLNAE